MQETVFTEQNRKKHLIIIEKILFDVTLREKTGEKR